MYNREMPCRACGKMILFIKTAAGKTMPVDSQPVRFRKDDSAKGLFVLQDGSTAHGESCSIWKANAVGYISHFATCPNADDFRKTGKKARKRKEV